MTTMADLLSDNPDVMGALLGALCDPGRFVEPAPLEPLESWQRRAVVEHAAPYIRDAERDRIAALVRDMALHAVEGVARRALMRAADAIEGKERDDEGTGRQ